MTKEKNLKGIKIPEVCGRAEKYALTAIMYHDENKEAEMKECAIFITEEDYQDNKIYVTVSGNMNPTLVLFPDEYNKCTIGYLGYRDNSINDKDKDNIFNTLSINQVLNSQFRMVTNKGYAKTVIMIYH